jgi:hypothetical protein
MVYISEIHVAIVEVGYPGVIAAQNVSFRNQNACKAKHGKIFILGVPSNDGV